MIRITDAARIATLSGVAGFETRPALIGWIIALLAGGSARKGLGLPLAVLTIAFAACYGTAHAEWQVLTNRQPARLLAENSTAELLRAAADIEAVQESAVAIGMLSDYAALRDQARA